MSEMKALAFNGSPLMEKSNTSLILNPFLEGLREEGVETELLYTMKLNLRPCLGDGNCWVRTPGKCVQNDAAGSVLVKLRESDIVVLACPVYVDGMPGQMKNMFDRLLPALEPYFDIKDGHCRHALREGYKPAKAVLVSNCGFWEMDNFVPLVTHVKAICKNASWDYAGALLRPHGPAFSYMLEHNLNVKDVLEAAQEAGRELARDGKMQEATLKTVGRELLPLKQYVEATNQLFKTEIDKHSKRFAGSQ